MSSAGIHIRTCVGCRKKKPKSELVRIVIDRAGLTVDASGQKAGRGAYLCADANCLDAAMKRAAPAQALKAKIAARELEEFRTGFRKYIKEQKVS